MRDMADMQRRFLGRDPAGMPFPAFPGMNMGMNNGGFLPGVPPRGLRNAPAPPQPQPGDDGKEVVRKTPEGVTKFRRFQGPPNGSQGFIRVPKQHSLGSNRRRRNRRDLIRRLASGYSHQPEAR